MIIPISAREREKCQLSADVTESGGRVKIGSVQGVPALADDQLVGNGTLGCDRELLELREGKIRNLTTIDGNQAEETRAQLRPVVKKGESHLPATLPPPVSFPPPPTMDKKDAIRQGALHNAVYEMTVHHPGNRRFWDKHRPISAEQRRTSGRASVFGAAKIEERSFGCNREDNGKRNSITVKAFFGVNEVEANHVPRKILVGATNVQ